MTAAWAAWVAAPAAPLHARLARRPAEVVVGVLMASGRRTAASGWRAAGVGQGSRSYDYFLDSLGREAFEVAAVLLRIVAERVGAGDRSVFALDDTPTGRYGPKVQGAGIHHNPTPGPAGSKLLHGPSWVTLSRVAHHARCGVIGSPLPGMLYVRKEDIPGLPDEAGVAFRTKLVMAAEAVNRLGPRLPGDARPWVVVDGGYAEREFLKPAIEAGFAVAARLRKDAAPCGLPPVTPSGQKRGRGRPPTYGKGRLGLAKRAGRTRGWAEVTVEATTGRSVVRRDKTFPATRRPAGGLVRVVILGEEHGSWRAFPCTDAGAGVEAIVQAVQDRWAIEQNDHDLKEVEGIERVQSRRMWSDVGAFDLSLWVHTPVEVRAWGRPETSSGDREDRPWDDASRRPSHADRRKALRRAMVEEGYRRLALPEPWSEKIRHLLAGVVRLAG